MPTRRPTIRDVAKAAGVSVTTVSDAVNGKGRVDPDTRQRVLDAAAEVGWQPTRAARALRSGRTGIIALCLPRRPEGAPSWIVSTDYYMELAAASATEAAETGQLVLLTPGTVDLDELRRLEIDGAIVVDPMQGDPTLAVLDGRGVPTVTVDREPGSASSWWVATDGAAGTRLLLDHLDDRGAGVIALLASPEPWSWLDDSVGAYTAWCADRGTAPLVADVDLDEPSASAEKVVAELLAGADPPDAVVALPYGAAVGAVRAVAATGRSVPGDVLVASGVDGLSMLASTPRITALHLDPAGLGRAAVQLLSRRIGGETGAGPTVLSAELRVRDST